MARGALPEHPPPGVDPVRPAFYYRRIVSLLAFPLLLVFFVFVAWRVRVERGVVLRDPTALDLLRAAIRDLERAVGSELLPLVERFAADFVALAAAASVYAKAMRRFELALLGYRVAQARALARITRGAS